MELQMLLALEGLFGEQQPFENKASLIWLLNSKYLLPSVEVLPKVLLLKQTWTYGLLMLCAAGSDCCGEEAAFDTLLSSLLAQEFLLNLSIGILPKFLLSELKANCLLVKLDPLCGLSASRTDSGSGLNSFFSNSRNYMFVRSVF